MSEKIEPVAWAVDLDGTGSLHMCAKGDPGAIELYHATTVSALEGEVAAAYAAVESRAGWEWRRRANEAEALLSECFEWLFESRADGPRASEGAIQKGYYTADFASLHERISKFMNPPGELQP